MRLAILAFLVISAIACNPAGETVSAADSTHIADSMKAATAASAEMKALLDSARHDVKMVIDTGTTEVDSLGK